MELYHVPRTFPAITFKFNNRHDSLPLDGYRISPHCRPLTGMKNLKAETDVSRPEYGGRMFILGTGFVGQFFAQELKNLGWCVSATCKNTTKKRELEERGFDIYLFDANEPELSTLNTLKHHTHLLVSIPPVIGTGDPMLQHEEHLRSTLIDGNLQWLCYLSSTSVYGSCGGSLVDEDDPTRPLNELGKLRIAAEDGWLNLGSNLGLSTHVFRLGGIYGPGRSAVDTIIKQKPLSEGQRMRVRRQFTSRVHVADICQALKASIDTASPRARKVYNIVDDDPAPREEVFAYAMNLVERKWPGKLKVLSEKSEPVSEGGRPRGDKRVSNLRMKKELGVKLLHPSYKSGLESIINQMGNPFE